MAASYTATAKRAMCGVSASLNSRGATAAFHPPHTTPSPASANITNTIVLLNEQLAWKAAETYRVWLDAENEASDKKLPFPQWPSRTKMFMGCISPSLQLNTLNL